MNYRNHYCYYLKLIIQNLLFLTCMNNKYFKQVGNALEMIDRQLNLLKLEQKQLFQKSSDSVLFYFDISLLFLKSILILKSLKSLIKKLLKGEEKK